ncbi:MAG TPA: hypothetical protein VLE95_06475, partial [Chlamydiales bacterium]|nr:hypothetical protein [Chlamydiales bacterium]
MTTLALDIMSRIPRTEAKQATGVEEEACTIICSPLPGDDKDAPEKACQQICKEGNVVTKIAEWTQDKAGKIMNHRIVKSTQPYTRSDSKVGLWAGLKTAENRFLKRGLYSSILAPFSRIDFWQLSIPPKGRLLNH